MKNDLENKVMENEDNKDIEIDLEQIGDKVAGGLLPLVPRDKAARATKERCDKG